MRSRFVQLVLVVVAPAEADPIGPDFPLRSKLSLDDEFFLIFSKKFIFENFLRNY